MLAAMRSSSAGHRVAHNPLDAHVKTVPTFPAWKLSTMLWTLAYVPAVRKNNPIRIMRALIAAKRMPVIDFSRRTSMPPSALRIRKYATPQKMKPKKLSNSDDIRDNKSEKKGITSAMMKAAIHKAPRIPAHAAHPTTV